MTGAPGPATRRRSPRSRPDAAGRRGWCRRGSDRSRARRRAAGCARPAARRRRARATSAPVRRPVTAMLPPKNRLATGTTSHRCTGGGGEVVGQRRQDPGAVLARAGSRRRGCRNVRRIAATSGVPDVARTSAGTGRAVALGRGAVDPGEEAGAGPLDVDRPAHELGPHLALRTARPCRCRSRAGGGRRRRRGPGTAVRRGGSTRRTRRPGAGPAHATNRSCHAATMSMTRSASARVCGRISGSVVWSLTPSGTTPTDASAGKRSSTPSSVSSSASPSLMPGHTTTWPCTSMPASSSAASQRRLVAPRRLRSSRARSSGSVAWMLT